MNDFVPWRYTDDRGRTYRTRALAEEVAQQTGDPAEPILGGETPTGADASAPILPASVKPRRVYCVEPATGYTRTIRVYEPTAPILTAVPKPTIVVEDSDGAAHTMVFEKLLPESFGRRP
jgi:hypothetical protein